MLVEGSVLGWTELVGRNEVDGRRVFVGAFVMLGWTESLDGKVVVVGREEEDGTKL